MKPSLRWLDYAIWVALGAGLLYLLHARASGPDEGTIATPFELRLANRDGSPEPPVLGAEGQALRGATVVG